MSKNDLEVVIGLEVHVQLDTKSKIFCSCPVEFEAPPNTNICPVCCGYPGTLPVLNKRALELALRVALALNCRINRRIYFERKNYFYPDLPKNYQISQYLLPLGEEGYLILPSGNKIGIKRVHLEEDAGKLIHRDTYSLVDFNRTGIPLLEIVSHPDMRSPEEAFQYLNELKLLIQYIGASTCDMEKGYLRCDANISLRRRGDKALGTKVELKNMNTFRGVKNALTYEVQRQKKLMEEGGKIIQETRLWDEVKAKTFPMRTKEEAHDYRYFPEPDLVDFTIDEDMIKAQREAIGELPQVRRERFKREFNLSDKEIEVLISQKKLADFFEECLKYSPQIKSIVNWLIGPFLEILYSYKSNIEDIKISPQDFTRVVEYFTSGKLNNITAKKVLSVAISTGEDVDRIIEKEGLVQVSDENKLKNFVEEVIKENEKAVSDYLQGKQSAVQFLVGQVMRKSRGKANPKVVKEMIEKSLKKGG